MMELLLKTIGTALATIISVKAGFTAVTLCAALAYGLTLAAGRLYGQGSRKVEYET